MTHVLPSPSCPKVSVRWDTGKRLTNRLPYLSLTTIACRHGVSCKVRILHIQPRESILYHANCTGITRQHVLNHTDHTDQEYTYISALNDLDHVLIVEMDGLSEVCTF